MAGAMIEHRRIQMSDFLDTRELNMLQTAVHEERADETPAFYAPEAMESFTYFHPERFMDGLGIEADVLEEARGLVAAGQYQILSFETKYNEIKNGRLEGIFRVEFPREDRRGNRISGVSIQVTLRFDSDRIREARCTFWKCYGHLNSASYLGLTICPHQAAALLLLQDYLLEHETGDGTNAAGERFLAAARLQRQKAEGSAEDLILVPSITGMEKGVLSCEFSIGTEGAKGKLYKVRNIRDLLAGFDQRDVMQFGRSELLLDPDRLQESSRKWLDFLRGSVEEEDELLERWIRSGTKAGLSAGQSAPKMKNSIPLFGARLDDFMEIAAGTEVPAEEGAVLIGSADGEADGETAHFPLALTMKERRNEEDDAFLGVELSGEVPTLLKGRRRQYALTDRKIQPIAEKADGVLLPILENAVRGKVRIEIGRDRLPEFYRKVLPRLQEEAEVTEYDSESIERHLPPEPEFVLYMDAPAGEVICRADVFYGPQAHALMDQGNSQGQYRNRTEEQKMIETISRYLPEQDLENGVFVLNRNDEGLYTFLSEGMALLMDSAEVRATDRFRRLGVKKHLSMNLGISMENGLLDIDLTSHDLTEEELMEALYRYRERRPFMRLSNGDFLKLEDNETLEKLSEMLDQLQISPTEFVRGNMHIPAYRALYLQRKMEEMPDVYTERDAHFKNLIKEFRTVSDADFAVPDSLMAEPRKYQIEGFRWLATLHRYGFGGILADDMGLGKTLQMIMLLLWQKEYGEGGTSLVVCPASLVYNWREELNRFAPSLLTEVVAGSQEERAVRIAGYQNVDVLITSYDTLKRDIAEYEGKEFAFVVADEAQYIKNEATSAAKSVKLLQAATRYALTGTPIENRLSELWSIFDFLMPGFLYEQTHFRMDFETPIMKNGAEGPREELRKMVTPFILRRMKADVLTDLPEKLEEIRYAAMEDVQQKLYDAEVLRMKDELSEQTEEAFRHGKIELLAELMRIRQICCDPSLCFENYDGGSAKKEMCMELVESLIEGEHRMLIFSQFKTMLLLLEEELSARNIPYYLITGDTPKERRLQMVKQFNEDDTPVFLISLKAGGTGLNLTGADAVIHYDPWWNFAVQNQATDRAYRIGQEKIVTEYRLIMKGTVEEKVVEMQEDKRKLSDDLLAGENISSAVLDRDELMALLG